MLICAPSYSGCTLVIDSAAEFLNTDKPGVLLTFDDGLANNHVNALPVLQEFNAPAIFFVSTQHVTDPQNWLPATRLLARKGWGMEEAVPEEIARDFYNGMSQEQLAECATHPLITIGSHTISHPFLTRCELQELEEELVGSKQVLEKITGRKIDFLAYPTGDYDARVAQAARSAGYRAAFAVDALNVASPLFEIPRVGIYASDASYLSLKLSGLHRRPLRSGQYLRYE
jgi:peptidoglycan/xylan/chitin deacetylase (PgdA/CDA1 family)